MRNTRRICALALAALLAALTMAGCQGAAAKTYVVLDDALDAEQYGVGFRNEDIALGLEVQKQLDAMIADGTAAEISEKWFGADILIRDAAYLEEDTAPAGDESLQKVLNQGTLVLGLDDSFPPMGFRDESNNIVGFDIDLATEVCKRMGVKLELQPIDWDAKEMELSSGKIDCIWNGMSIDDER
ncbi:MAG: transporter substrate-binding domain-containing protein, partial [Eubacteriales bacterium]|nr:transporter substrate-binding domain-containing protein [Eubacteriales bacterium]